MNRGTADRIVRVLLDQARCTECGSPYHAEDVHILRHHEERIWDLAVVCNVCYTLSLIRAVVRITEDGKDEWLAGSHRVSFASELTTAERRHFAALTPVGTDDVLDVSDFLAGFDGDFRRVFEQDGVD